MKSLTTDDLIRLMEQVLPPELYAQKLQALIVAHRSLTREMAKLLKVEYGTTELVDGRLVSTVGPKTADQAIPIELALIGVRADGDWSVSQPTPSAIRA